MKKIIALLLAVIMTATVSVAGTMAYLTSEDSDVNVMTLGNVKIAQHEYERVVNADGSYEMVNSEKYGEGYKLQPFTQAKPLYPATGTITGWGTKVPFDQLDDGASGAQSVFAGLNNVQDKFVLVENTGRSDAYVRTLIALEYGSNTKDIIGISTGDFWTWNDLGVMAIDGNNFSVYEAIYAGSSTRHVGGILPAGEYTYNSLGQIYLKNEATNEDMEALDGNGNGTYDVLVLSQAVQIAGFDNAQEALDEAFGDANETTVPAWFSGLGVPVLVDSADELKEALEAGETAILTSDITLDDTKITIASGKSATLNLNGHTITGAFSGTGNQEMFLVKGELTVSNGNITMTATKDQGWNAMATIFDVTAGGVLNIDNAVLNTSGTSMSFCVHLNNWGEVTLDVTNSTLKANYIPVRVFNSGNDMNNVTIANSTLEGKYCFWVHNYTEADFGTAEKAEAHKALLNLDIIGNGNTFTNTGKAPILYGFTNAIYTDANGNVVE